MENQFPCQDTEGNPLCISELQFCDGVSDCGDGSDEPSYCSDGMLLHCAHYTIGIVLFKAVHWFPLPYNLVKFICLYM